MNLQEDRKPKVWTSEETLGLLKCCKAHKDELKHTRKTAYAYILEDMISQRLTDSSTTVEAIEARMKSLLHDFEVAKDNQQLHDGILCDIPYNEELEEIFGDSPTIMNDHTLHVGFGRTFPLGEEIGTIDMEECILPTDNFFYFRGTGSEAYTSSSHARKRTAKQMYHLEKAKLKREFTEKNIQLKENFISDMKKSWKLKTDAYKELTRISEERKLEILEAIANLISNKHGICEFAS